VLTTTLRSAWSHKRRLVGTVLAVAIGVAFLTGTLVFNATLDRSFEDLFTDAVGETDVEVRSTSALQDQTDAEVDTPVSADLVDQLSEVDGVAAAVPVVEGFGQLIGADGDPIGGQGPPTLAGSWVQDPDLNPYELDEGRAPGAPGEVVVNRAAAEAGDLVLGDTTTLNTPAPLEVTIVGISTFAGGDGLGGVTFAALPLEQAQELLLGGTDVVSSIRLKAEDAVSQDELAMSVADVLPEGTEAVTGDDLVAEATSDISADFLGFFQTFLLVFAGVALLVAAFSINNTLSILVAQRTRDAALLRALGATRSQVLASVVVEALLLGIIGAGVGAAAGLGLAYGLKALLAGFGFDLPAEGLVLSAGTIGVGLALGTAVTLLAGVLPAVRASRVAPLAALRDVAVDRSATGPVRLVVGGLLLLAGVGLVVGGVVAGGDGALTQAGLGAVVTLIGVVVVGPVAARPAAGVLGWPLARLRGLVGSMARRNAMRNPRRTSSTAAALMVGVGVVTLFTVFAGTVKASLEDSIDRSFGGDLVISSSSFDAGQLDPTMATTVGALPEVASSVGLAVGAADVEGGTRQITAADLDELDSLVDLDVADGSLDQAGDDAFAVRDIVAEDHGWEVGDVVPVTFADGQTVDLTLAATFQATELAGEWLVPRSVWQEHTTQAADFTVLIALADGVGLDEGQAAVEQATASFGTPDVMDRQEYADQVAGFVDQALGLVYAMLALAIVIALMGIANTLALSIHERTRELGLLRAVGQTRPQVRAMVRWESLLIATFGTVGGLGLGVFLGWALVEAAGQTAAPVSTFAIPIASLLVILVAGAVAGVLAGINPARRAAKLDVLQAVATE
jgi:putative ABC transport system permease protein